MVDDTFEVNNEHQASKEVRAKQSLLHELKLQVMKKVSVIFPVPNIHDDFVFTKSPVFWFIFVPNTLRFVDVSESKEQDAECYLRDE